MQNFHYTLERYFRSNFTEELNRMALDVSPIAPSISPSSHFPPQGIGSLTRLHERNRSQASNVTGVTARSKNFYLPPLQLGRSVVTPPPASPISVRTQTLVDNGASSGANVAAINVPHSKQTPLQRNLAHLARHGFNGVAVGPGPGANSGSDTGLGLQMGTGDSITAGSPQGSYVNVASTIPAPSIASGAMSMVTSNIGSSIGSIKGRFSRLGSLNFGRHGREGRNGRDT